MHIISRAMIWAAAALLSAPAAIVTGSLAPAEAASKRPGGTVATGRSSVSRPAARPAGASKQGRPQASAQRAGGNSRNVSSNRSGSNTRNVSSNRSGGNTRNVSSNRGGNTVVVDNSKTVVAGNNRGGYYDGRHYDNDWDNDDNDFLEFVGKTAAVTAAVSVTAAVIGSVVNDKPDNCQQVVSGGQVYQYCDGTYYVPVSNGYQVVAPPR